MKDDGNELAALDTIDNMLKQHIALLEAQLCEQQATAQYWRTQATALRTRVEHYQHLFDVANDALFLFALEPDGSPGRFTDVNERACGSLHYSREELLSMSVMQIDSAEARENIPLYTELLRHTGQAIFESRHLRKDGTSFPVEVSVHIVEINGVPHGVSIVRDITERKQAEQALKDAEVQYRTVADFTYDWETWENPDGTLRYVSPACERITGYTAELFYADASLYNTIIIEEDRPIWAQHRQAGPAEHAQQIIQFRIRRRDGALAWIEHACCPVTDAQGVFLGTRASNRDITERKQLEQALHRSRESYQSFISNSHEAIYCTEFDQPIDTSLPVEQQIDAIYEYAYMGECNQAMALMYGLPSADAFIGQRMINFHGGKDNPVNRATFKRLIESGYRSINCETEELASDGTKRFFLSNDIGIVEHGRLLRIWGTAVEITERKQAEAERQRLQEQLAHAQKMESVGRLAGGIAHDFNNMLGVILGHVEMALDQVDPAQPLAADLEAIQKAARRSTDLTRQLLAFARKQTINPRVIDINEAVEALLRMLRRLIGEAIDLRWCPGNNLWPVRIDPTQLDQILANLCVNARDAIAGIGTITIETDTALLDERYCIAHPGATPGAYVLLTVRDDGCGMDQATLAHLFEPFFTTKGVGQGTGLGLATVYGIVTQNNGFITVSSAPGKGATFTIYLLRYLGEATPRPGDSSVERVRRGQETVLLVEDEPAILNMSQRMLERLGYRVVSAGTPGEAIALAAAHAGAIDLLITDVVMPEMSGWELARTLHQTYPQIKQLFMSGHGISTITEETAGEVVKFMQKPFSMQELAAQVRASLDQQ